MRILRFFQMKCRDQRTKDEMDSILDSNFFKIIIETTSQDLAASMYLFSLLVKLDPLVKPAGCHPVSR